MTAKTKKRKYTGATCATCGRRLYTERVLVERDGKPPTWRSVPQYVFSRFTGNRYCIPCCVKGER